MHCYRIARPAFAASALSGEGARLHGGRWNSPGRACVYAAESRALAVLELLVHLPGITRALPFRLLTLEVPDALVDPPPELPDGWATRPASPVARATGDRWLAGTRSTALRVPSVILPEESILLLNPRAAGFATIQVVHDRAFRLDLRLAAGT